MMYWKNEPEAELYEIVMKWLRDQPLSGDELHTLQEYIYNYANSVHFKPDDLAVVFQMDQHKLKEYNYYTLYDIYGIAAV